MPTFSLTDLNLTQEFRMGGNKRLQVMFNVLNLFNQDADSKALENPCHRWKPITAMQAE